MLPTSPGPDRGLLELLNLLREEDSFISGEVLAARVGLSRAGVWKRLHRLKTMGYLIEGEPRRGYRLLAAPDKLFAEEVLHRLGTTYLRGPIYHFESAPSTNDTAKLLGTQGAAEGVLVLAETQTTGRGRLGRFWLSPPSLGIYASLLLRPPLPPTELPQITLSTAVAVVRALTRAAGVTPGIKWPNDLILNGKKLGGILTEMETESDQIRYLVVGLGLNVNNPDFPRNWRAGPLHSLTKPGAPFPAWPSCRPGWRSLKPFMSAFWPGAFPRFWRNGSSIPLPWGNTWPCARDPARWRAWPRKSLQMGPSWWRPPGAKW
ncbi:MAG: biotin--[acetyl-CoA-carboxylase] ligase [Desulfobaccales bacterium]